MHYRIAELETDEGSPSDLGEIGPWLERRGNVVRTGSHRIIITRETLPPRTTVMVLEHAPYVGR